MIEVYSTIYVEGTHNWPICPFDEVDYLRDPHSHMFVIKAYSLTEDPDREKEFIIDGHRIEEYLKDKYWDEQRKLCAFGHQSCEHIGTELVREFGLTKCDISEDGRNGAIVYA